MSAPDHDLTDIPEPEEALEPPAEETSAVDPGGDIAAPPPPGPGLGEDPAYDPGGMGEQPDVAEDADEHP